MPRGVVCQHGDSLARLDSLHSALHEVQEVFDGDVLLVHLNSDESFQTAHRYCRQFDFVDGATVVYQVFAVLHSGPVMRCGLHQREVDLVDVQDSRSRCIDRLNQMADGLYDLSCRVAVFSWCLSPSDQLTPTQTGLLEVPSDQLLRKGRQLSLDVSYRAVTTLDVRSDVVQLVDQVAWLGVVVCEDVWSLLKRDVFFDLLHCLVVTAGDAADVGKAGSWPSFKNGGDVLSAVIDNGCPRVPFDVRSV